MYENVKETAPRRKFALVFLDAGNGHRAQATVLKEVLSKYIPEEDIILLHGFGKGNRILSFFVEKGYNFSINYAKGSFPLLYDIGQHRFFTYIVAHIIDFFAYRYAKKMISTLGITDVVSFHFATTPVFAKAARKAGRPVSMTAITADPFTGPNAWFYDKRVDTIVYSEEMKQVALKNGVPENKIFIMPFLLNKKFRVQDFSLSRAQMKTKLGFDSRFPLLLIAGGGEGLPGAKEIVEECARINLNAEIGVICGRNKVQEKYLRMFAKLHPKKHIHIFAFVTNMNEFLHAADVVVTKSGPSVMFETISCKCPLIISHYIHNQELGNMQFVVKNRLGFFIQKPKDIGVEVKKLLEDSKAMADIHSRCDNYVLDTHVEKIAEFLLAK